MTVRFGPYLLDVAARRLTRDGQPMHLSPKAFDLLTLLVEQRPAVIGKAAIRQRLWPDVHVVDAALTNLVAEIRGVLREGAGEQPFLRTVHGVGYAFGAEAITQNRGEDRGEATASRGGESDNRRTTPFWLVWRDRPIVLGAGEQVMGRDAACGVWVDAEGVSRRHARIRVPSDAESRGVTIEDLGSTNGTYVQNRRIAGETKLENGDRIQMGHAKLVFRAAVADRPTRRVKRKS